MTAEHVGLMVAGGVVVLSGDWLQVTLTAVQMAERGRRLKGLPDSPAHRRLAGALRTAMAACPQTDGPKPAAAQTKNNRWLTAKEAAEMLGCSQRHARRLAPKLDGDRSSGPWFIPQAALLEHMEGRA